ncbi:hypothetical protein WK24_10830 [Burkholderia vietnamiensis]|uniref:hypothetical protein n=1 Tax=Burkholderia vietnamiensis TaxID=60552 RepID=UPI000751F336|nr:hypothetical protein [Burkholderia vietnamiensis]KVR71565.1 hypothetical protein WK24_10830 [Burkholderia vietnamiensis]MBR8034512.1 hypothetical protein [Burkholderia vietnamiensis]
MPAYKVFPYTVDNLIQCFVDGSKLTTSIDAVREKRHRVYFEEYFAELGAATIVVECDYVDRDYLEDYAAYYDRCFREYSRRTQRLHFFRNAFDGAAFEAVLVRSPSAVLDEARLRASYLGFIVVKPLPITIVGRTCLSTYPDDGGRRWFPILRKYPVSLFGIDLEIETLAYQEQDTVVAACATSALWSCFQGTGKLFQHVIPPPVEITDWAGDHLPEDLVAASSRAFPNSGLTATQMAHAVKRVGLEPFAVGAETRYGLNSVTYAYLRGKIPSLLACQLHSDLGAPDARSMGGHAIALTGFSLGNQAAIPSGPTGFLLRASRIDKLYGHDDQVGPFARMVWETTNMSDESAGLGGEGPDQQRELLRTSWEGVIHADPNFVLVPLYHKIRIPFNVVHDAVLELDAMVEPMRQVFFSTVARAEWDIYLTTVSEYKASARSEYPALGLDLGASVTASLPRFLWRVIARTGERLQLDILFDATGIAQHDLVVHVVSSGGEYSQMIAAIALGGQAVLATLKTQTRALFNRFRVSPLAPTAP